MPNVLVTCGGMWVGLVLQLKQAMRRVPPLRDGRLLVADRCALTPAGCFADAAFQVPEVAHPLYVERLLDLCLQQDVRVLVPHLDIDLDHLAPQLGQFAQVGTVVVCPPPDLVELCRDKARFEAFARQERLPCPRSYPADALREELFPLFAKRRRGSASVGAGVCRSLAEARAALEREPELLFQEWMADREASVDAYIASGGRCTVRVPRWRDKVTGGEAVRSHTFRCAAVCGLADRTLAALARAGLRGPLNIQIFAGEAPTLIEVNTRLGSASLLSNLATGGRFYAAVLQEACGDASEGDPDDYQEGLGMYRYWGEVFHDGDQALAFFPPREA